MTREPDALPSRTYIDKCGWALVDYWHGAPMQQPMPAIAEAQAVDVLNAFRRAHESPLLRVRLGLYQFLRSEQAPGVVTQRLKRRARIVRKLYRLHDSKLSRLEDIGGCRAIVATPGALERVRNHIEKTWSGSIRRRRDYIAEPNAAGYRAYHFVVERDHRRVEIQLRTRQQQQWADAVEAADSRLGLTLKDGVGPDVMIEYFRAAGDLTHAIEYGEPITPEAISRLDSVRDAVIAAGYYKQ